LTIDEKEKRRMEGKKLQKKERNILRREMKSMDAKKYSFFLLKLIIFFKKISMTGCSRLYKEVYWWTFFWEVRIRGHPIINNKIKICMSSILNNILSNYIKSIYNIAYFLY